MAIEINLNDVAGIKIQTVGEWVDDGTVYPENFLLITSDAFFTGTDQRRFKISDGVQPWTTLDYFPDVQSNLTTHINNTSNPHSVTKSQVGLGSADNTSDVDKPVSTAQAAAIASAVAGLMDYRGVFDASVNAYPSSGGSGSAGAILKSDFWIVSVAGTLPTGLVVEAGDLVIAKIDTPGNTQANWSIVQYNIGYTPENAANKATTLAASSTQYPNNDAVIAALILKSNLIALVGSTAAARGDNVTQYHGKLLGASPATTATNRRFQFMRAGTITHILYQISATNVPSNEAVPLSLRQNNTTDHFLTNIDWSVVAANVPSPILVALATPITVNTTDTYELKEATPAMGTNPVSAVLIVEFLTL